MTLRILTFLLLIGLGCTGYISAQSRSFVTVRGHNFYRNGAVHYFIGANYWYGSLLGLEEDKKRGVMRLRQELDFLKANGVTNLRLMAGAEGAGLMNGVTRVGPPLQPELGKFDEKVLKSLDLVLYEMGKRKMTGVIFLSNNWEWSGGFQQYLIWNGVISDRWLTQKPSWDELRDNVARFYSCRPCIDAYIRQAERVVGRTNSVSGKRYVDDPTIMAWELANEPRPMRPGANDVYEAWVEEAASIIKSLDRKHLVTIGHEGWIGTQDIALYETINAVRNIDYLTIHIWPKNWGWFADGKMADDFTNIVRETDKYIAENLGVAIKLNKPLVIEEFGLPRDRQSFDPVISTSYRDNYYKKIFSFIGDQLTGSGYVGGANFWAFGGTARPKRGHIFWKPSDDLIGDPPMEKQGLNSVFNSDQSTWRIIRSASSFTRNRK